MYSLFMHMGTKPRTGDLTFRMPLFDDEVRCDLARARASLGSRGCGVREAGRGGYELLFADGGHERVSHSQLMVLDRDIRESSRLRR